MSKLINLLRALFGKETRREPDAAQQHGGIGWGGL